MNRLFVLFFIVSVTQLAYADNNSAITAENWIGAAKFALSKTQYAPDTIFVVDGTLDDAALGALRSLGPVISKDNLPQQDLYVIPPGPYMLVRKFYERNGVFEFTETTGAYLKDAHRNCGETWTISTRLGISGAWEFAGPTHGLVC